MTGVSFMTLSPCASVMPRPRINHSCASKPLIDLREIFAFDRVSNDVASVCDVATGEATPRSNAREMGGMSGGTVVFRAGASKRSTSAELAEVHKVGHKSSMTRQSFHTGVSLAALAALLVCGCFTREVLRTESHDPPDQFNALLDSMINDRRTWVDPPGGI